MSDKAQAVRAGIEAALAAGPNAEVWDTDVNWHVDEVNNECWATGPVHPSNGNANNAKRDAIYIRAVGPANIRILLDDHDAKLRAAEGRVAALTEALSSIILAADSKEAQGGARWFAEAVSGPIEDARAALATNRNAPA